MELRHGYTLADLHNLARLAVHTAGAMASDWHERYDTAYSAIAEALYAADHWPPRHDLVRAGQLAIYDVIKDHRHHHGYFKHKTIGAAMGPGSSPAFITYWMEYAAVGRSPERRIVDREALAQILPALTPTQRRCVLALAVHDNYQAAAAAIDMTYVTFKSHIAAGRRRFLALWHEGEIPSKPWGVDRRAGRKEGGTAQMRPMELFARRKREQRKRATREEAA